MEGNRILWVIFSLTLLVVVVLAGGLYLFRPTPEQAAIPSAAAPPIEGFDSFEYVRDRTELPGLEPEEGEPEEMVIVVGEKEPPEGEVGEEVAQEPGDEVVVKAIPPAERPEPAKVAPTRKPIAAKAPAKAPPARPSAARRPPAKPAPQQVRVSEYWIQIGAYKSNSRAELIAASIEERGLPGQITAREVQGKTYYRVRLGPYLSRQEALKFLDWISKVQGFESSYISKVYAMRNVP